MQIELLSFADSDDINALRTTVKHMGCRDVRCVNAWSRDPSSEHIRVLFVQEPQRENSHLLRLIEQRDPIHLVLADSTEFLSTPALRHTALDFCIWPNSDTELEMRLNRFCTSQSMSEPDSALSDVCLRINLIGSSPRYIETLVAIRRFADTDASLLILGETGTGKELAARATHYLGLRHDGPFQAVNCGAIPESLVENELFGHASGAYTDARGAQPGLVEMAEGGTLFLDEVDSLPYKAQTALLRFLEDRQYRPLGSGQDRQANVRIIAASNTDLAQAAEEGGFRKDLFYRLHLLCIELPPLRDRSSDIPQLAAHFLERCAVEYQQGHKVFHPAVLEQLQRCDWPGNVRELEHFVHRAYLLESSPVIRTLAEASPDTTGAHSPPDVARVSEPLLQFSVAKKDAIEQFERDYLLSLLSCTGGNVSKAAAIAGKERRALGKLLKKHAIDRNLFANL